MAVQAIHSDADFVKALKTNKVRGHPHPHSSPLSPLSRLTSLPLLLVRPVVSTCAQDKGIVIDWAASWCGPVTQRTPHRLHNRCTAAH
jgi:hypothetical protein